ncbi:MAG: hypothetical protein IJW49_07965 [Clostridia bacterium]|nr:hypothetical protein [Clostridia bacterium]
MGNRPYRMSFRERLYRFFSGRNGSDALGRTVLFAALALDIANLFLNSLILYFVAMLLLAYSFFRMFSRNIYKRQVENQRFCRFFRPIKNFFVLKKNKRRDRKTHVYQKCPHCKKVLRLPRVSGEHTVRCPCCRHRFEMKIK